MDEGYNPLDEVIPLSEIIEALTPTIGAVYVGYNYTLNELRRDLDAIRGRIAAFAETGRSC